jgi:hypothetical protein
MSGSGKKGSAFDRMLDDNRTRLDALLRSSTGGASRRRPETVGRPAEAKPDVKPAAVPSKPSTQTESRRPVTSSPRKSSAMGSRIEATSGDIAFSFRPH